MKKSFNLVVCSTIKYTKTASGHVRGREKGIEYVCVCINLSAMLVNVKLILNGSKKSLSRAHMVISSSNMKYTNI